MKAPRYHKSKQCFDINATPTKFDQSTTITIDGSQVTYDGTWYVYYTINVKPNTDYYISWEIIYTEIAGRGTILIADSNGEQIVAQRSNPYSFNSGANTSIRVQIYIAGGTRATLILDHIMINEGTTPQPFEPYDPEVWHDCAVKRYTAGEEKNTLTDYSVTFNGLTTIKDRQFMKLEGTSTDAIFSTDESFRSSFNFNLEAGTVYIIAVSKYFSAEDVTVYVRYRNDNSIIVSSRDNPVAIIAPNIDTKIYSGFDFPARTSAPLVNPYLLVSYRYPGTWHDIRVYVRQNGVWVEQT